MVYKTLHKQISFDHVAFPGGQTDSSLLFTFYQIKETGLESLLCSKTFSQQLKELVSEPSSSDSKQKSAAMGAAQIYPS